MVHNAIHIANKIIQNNDSEHGELISNLKLQKLLYYVQGFNLAVFKRPLFGDKIEAWQYGPVVKNVYFHFNDFGVNSLSIKKSDSEIANLSNDEQELFDNVLAEYGKFSAVRLMNMTHKELPWKSVFYKSPQGEISHDLLIQFFKTRIVE